MSAASQDAALESAAERPVGELGMWVFLATEVLFFGVLFCGYVVMRWYYPQGFAAASRHTDVVIGSANTAVLLTSSLTMALAVQSLQQGAARRTVWLLAATLLLGAAFLGLKLYEYRDDYLRHLVPWLDFVFPGRHAGGARLFFYMYFVMTGAHALHLTVGLGVVTVMIIGVARGAFSRERAAPVEVAALYWHLIDVVWIFLYPILYLVART
ncbi:MAG TPA: cytochrome c oxidase subunit 3 [Steroidobacteraceae bacterium]|nr:cytochrome c oxidase subunit 3 [Steroidobacteraceae bacterium]